MNVFSAHRLVAEAAKPKKKHHHGKEKEKVKKAEEKIETTPEKGSC